MAGPFIDFTHVKSNTDVAATLEALSFEGRCAGVEIRIRCPQPDHDDRRASCDVNTEKRTFYCHSCHATGSIIDLVAVVMDTDARGACLWLHEQCGVPLSDRAHPQSPGRKARRQKQPEKDEPPAPPTDHNDEPAFTPFDKPLKLDAEHPFGIERGLVPATIAEFAMGFQDRGMFKGRWCIPIHDEDGNQLGYCGRHTGKRLPKDVEKWLLPKGFPKSEVLFNLHRATLHDGAVILVEGPLDAIRLHGLGLSSVVALMGISISDRQIAHLEGRAACQVLLMLDGDAPGRKAVPELLARLGQSFFVRDVKLPDGHDPEDVPEDFLRAQLWWL